MTESDEGYRERYIASTLDAFCYLQRVAEDPDTTCFLTMRMSKTELISLSGGLVSLLGIFVNSIAEEKDCSTQEALAFIGQNLTIGDE